MIKINQHLIIICISVSYLLVFSTIYLFYSNYFDVTLYRKVGYVVGVSKEGDAREGGSHMRWSASSRLVLEKWLKK